MKSKYFISVSADAQEVTICDETVLQNKVPGMEFNVSLHGVNIHPGCRRFDFLDAHSAITFTLVKTDTKPHELHEPYRLGNDLLQHG